MPEKILGRAHDRIEHSTSSDIFIADNVERLRSDIYGTSAEILDITDFDILKPKVIPDSHVEIDHRNMKPESMRRPKNNDSRLANFIFTDRLKKKIA